MKNRFNGLGLCAIILLVACQSAPATPIIPTLTEQPTALRSTPTLAPQSQKLVFTTYLGYMPLAAPGDIYTSNPDGSDLKKITQQVGAYESPFWSPAGQFIAFSSDHEGLRRLYTMHVDGSEITPVPNTSALDWLYGWSPDGRYLLVTSFRDVNAEVYAIPLDGSEAINLTRNPADDATPAWSPDGQQIAFASDRASTGDERVQQIYVMNVDGSNVRQLTHGSFDSTEPVWSPDGQFIAFNMPHTLSGVPLDLYVVRADGSDQHRLTTQPGWWVPQAWTPDGTALLVNHVTGSLGENIETVLMPITDPKAMIPLSDTVAAAGLDHDWFVPDRLVPPIELPEPIAAPASAQKTLALINGTLIDGTGADPVSNAALVIRDGRIAAVGPRAEVDIPSDAQVIDVQGATLLPGFFNAHVHEAFDAYRLRKWARAGVTTVRDLSPLSVGRSALEFDYAFKNHVQQQPEYARIVASTPILSPPDGYGMLPVSGPQDAREKTNALLDGGADLIKIAFEDQVRGPQPLLPVSDAQAIVAAAHDRGVPVSAHISLAKHLQMALESGVDDVAHMITDKLPDELITQMVKQNVYWVPTLELWSGVGRIANMRDNLKRFVDGGGQVALGTDYAGYTIPFELGMPITEIELMHQAGMTPMQIIVAATKNAAHVSNRDRDLGTLEVGKIADVLIVNGDPLQDLHALLDVRLVVKDGVIIRR
jgi:imidazolonepropionase-like amidohydrolase/Tol biopolymer transport system component